MNYRKSSLGLLGAHVGRLSAMAQGKVAFDPRGAAESAEVVAMTSRLAFTGFREASTSLDGSKATEIWQER